jgi:hypothetical protein
MRSLPLGISQNSMPAAAAVSVRRELGAYEALWLEQGATFKTVASKFAIDPTALPSDLVPRLQAEECAPRRWKRSNALAFTNSESESITPAIIRRDLETPDICRAAVLPGGHGSLPRRDVSRLSERGGPPRTGSSEPSV